MVCSGPILLGMRLEVRVGGPQQFTVVKAPMNRGTFPVTPILPPNKEAFQSKKRQ